MVKKSSQKKTQKVQRNVIPPENVTGYPMASPCNCPAEILRKAAGGGKRSGS